MIDNMVGYACMKSTANACLSRGSYSSTSSSDTRSESNSPEDCSQSMAETRHCTRQAPSAVRWGGGATKLLPAVPPWLMASLQLRAPGGVSMASQNRSNSVLLSTARMRRRTTAGASAARSAAGPAARLASSGSSGRVSSSHATVRIGAWLHSSWRKASSGAAVAAGEWAGPVTSSCAPPRSKALQYYRW